ncbi:DUF1353 domain-containing protein, partial [Salmonella enterica subsp. enterica serovar Montevideo]|nr:DUF1353 domain-containing protein [Salmonella enterica subsp. enterica serovar Montevideo]
YLSEDKNDVIEVPVGFVTDLATVPRIFWSLLPPDGEYAKAAISLTLIGAELLVLVVVGFFFVRRQLSLPVPLLPIDLLRIPLFS